MSLRVISDETPPLSKSELQDQGNKLLTEARHAGLAALRKSCDFQLLEEPRSYSPASIRFMLEQAEDAVKAWQEVASKLAEIRREYEKAKNAGSGVVR